ncbi:diguanylate cyclase (GGDEF) domain-containing protein [Malonomonas rubra DSM 5091]|uniref:diguanylate cyclase n=1 Tax=Malonomonas rubra DSM 5091 TaxID=1122189 RepID=A0A1M6G519_MALRU|nr:diguanylate cyclase [Malonomonas rubra]SHJ05106.1 diguanylate cyclase (GGDEF) domain-containing protein [Malonomonas rubra DSM 5091]
MKDVLIVEDSRLFSGLLQKRIAKDFMISSTIKESYREAEEHLQEHADRYSLAVLDLTLPGSPDGEIVDLVVEKGLSVIVVTGRMDDQTRAKILERQVLDYIMKGPHALDLLSSTIARVLRNNEISVLVVEDSNLIREATRQILQTQHFNVLEAKDGLAALEQLRADRSIKVVLTDYNMPNMDGFKLTAEIRKSFPMDQMAVIGMSAQGNPMLSAQFLKRGANDFINKPYFEEELVWRVNQNVEILDRIAQLRDASIKDAMTGLYNRRHFFEAGANLFANAQRENIDICVAMLDIDHFKHVNDTYGHATGDLVIKEVAQTLQNSFRKSDLVARIGGEEFVVIASNMEKDARFGHFDDLRQKIEDLLIVVDGETIPVTISIGVTETLADSLDEMVREADGRLYQAKESGRNCVIMN